MKKFCILFLLLCSSLVYAEEQNLLTKEKKQVYSDNVSCPENASKMIYDCEEFKCRFNVGMPGIEKEIEVVGFDQKLCILKSTLIVRTKEYPSMSLKLSCKLSELGRKEMSNQYKQFIEGDKAVYTQPQTSKIVFEECEAIH